ncbi:Mechanosensitive ion channel-domain-containing protein [Crucibulum laeve]|uniref:Mechanosensitive ion channel protein n=1 Tax=Crucibulum laeve TaxID=68775 RepID=A0A5C3MHQ9_9AGAR|nr:Mechanosensitive ion channel-domain-containing protein [Crucibulum laeve]
MANDGLPSRGYDAERAQPGPSQASGLPFAEKPGNNRNSSWDLFSNVKRFEQSYEQFDSRNASEAHLVYADGDVPKNSFAHLYHYLLNVSIVSRWIIFIVPVLGIVWIPGILSLTTFPNAAVWGVRLLWWSIWLSVCWGGWWAALATARIIPTIIRATLGLVAVGTRRYIDWMQALHRYIALFAWTLAIWVSWNPIIDNHQRNAGDKSIRAIDLIGKLLFSFFLCAAVLLFEKFSIQWIAGKFHERSYAERIAEQKFAVKSLVALYRHSVDIPGRSDTLSAGHARGASVNPRRIFKKFREGVRLAATTTTTAFGNVASEIAGSSVLQPNSPQAMVKTALESANKSRLLARRLFYSFAKRDAEFLLPEDIERFFPTKEEAHQVFTLFDKDANGDASRDEVEMACLEFHREQLSIENSMRDLDSAVGRLDNILMSAYVIVAILIIAVALEAQLVTLVTGAGTLILGLSWLIGGSLQEVLTSIIFLFVKHPFDVGDRIILNKETYTVKEIRLLSSVFHDSNSVLVQAPNNVLNTLFIQNMRRSPQAKTFAFDVSYSTTFEDLERLRDKMLEFVKAERRDYHPIFDVAVKDFPDQEKMSLTADIKYKSNGQLGALKAKRRNKWICALKAALAEVNIYGPKGNPGAPPGVTRYTEVPWDIIDAKDREVVQTHEPPTEIRPLGGWNLRDRNPAMRTFSFHII